MNPSKDRGTRWESSIVDYLRANGVPHAERRTLNGAKDRGDIAGLPGVVIEAKSAGRVELAGWVDEAEVERRNDNTAPVAVVWHHRKRKASPGDGFVTMTGAQFLGLLRTAGYLPEDLTESARPGAVTQAPAPGGATHGDTP